jgi:hypothetical protein
MLKFRLNALRGAGQATHTAVTVFACDVGRGLLEVSRNSLALVGLAAVLAGLFAANHPHVREKVEVVTLQWLQDRHEQRGLDAGNVLATVADTSASDRATAADLQHLPRPQAQLANWIARRYKVAPEPMAALVQEAWTIGQRAGLEPTLILAIMAVESSFNPFAQSQVGAQGLMQVMTHVHDDKYQNFGGNRAAFDPISNLRVGVQVLKECIRRAGSVEQGLRHYVGAALLDSDGGYAARVLAEQAHMLQVAGGRSVPITARLPSPGMTATPATAPAAGPSAAPRQVPDKDAVDSEQVALLR